MTLAPADRAFLTKISSKWWRGLWPRSQPNARTPHELGMFVDDHL
jgi:hypothetical protein